MRGNVKVRQIPWDDNQEFLQAWEEGRTGFPWIDAVMRQLQVRLFGCFSFGCFGCFSALVRVF